MGVMGCHDQRKRLLLFATAARNGLRRKNGLCSRQNPERVSFSMKSQRTTVDHHETLNNFSTTQSLPRAKVKPRPRTTRCLPQHTRVPHMRVAVVHGPRVCAVLVLIRTRGKDRAVSSDARRQRVSSHDRFAGANTALKTQYLRQSSQAVTLVGQIQSAAGWAFANNPPESRTFASSARTVAI